MAFMGRRRRKRQKERQKAVEERVVASQLDDHFINLKRTLAERAHPDFYDHIMAMDKQEFMDLLESLDRRDKK